MRVMKNLKKFLAVIITVALMATMMVPVFAADEISADAQTCANLEILKGENDGVTSDYLAKQPTRLQAAIIALRLLDLEIDALAFESDDNFADEDLGKWQGGINILAYLKANPDLGWKGNENGEFKPFQKITAQQLYKVMLETLGYEQDAEDGFTWGETLDFAADKGLDKIADITKLTNDDLAIAIVEALKADTKAGGTLIAKLVEDGIVDKDAAIEEGLISAEVTATVAATGAKKLQVTFDKAVEDTTKVTFAAKRGTVNVNVSSVDWNEAKTEATLTMVSKFIAGTYTVTVSGSELAEGSEALSIEVAAETVASVEILSDVAPLVGTSPNDITFDYEVKNQYGEDMTSLTTLNWTASQGTFIADPKVGTKRLNASFVKDQIIVVTALHASTGKFVSKNLTVADPARVSVIDSAYLYNAKNEELKTNSTYTDFYFVVEAKDQYGNSVTATQLNNDITVVNSGTNIVTLPGAFVSVPGTTKLGVQVVAPSTKVAGNALVTAISNYTGQSKALTITVGAAASLDSLVLQVPSELVVKGEKTLIPFTAFDQFGNELSETAKAALPNTLLSITDPNINFAFSYNYKTKKAELTLDATNASVTPGNKIIMAVTTTGKVSQITVEVKAAAKPVAVSGTKDLVTNMTIGATSTLTPANVVVIDTYGREMALNTTFFVSYKLDLVSATPANVTPATASLTGVGSSINLTGIANGSSVISIEIYDIANSSVIANSKFELTASTLAKSAIASYVVEAPEKLHNSTSHAKALNVYGKTSSGAKVALAAGDFSVTTNKTGFTYSLGLLDANGVTTGFDADGNQNATIIVVITGANGPETVTKAVVLTNVAPKLTTIELAAETTYMAVANASNANVMALFTGKDQYGVAFTPSITNVIYSDIASATMSVTSNGTATPTISVAPAAGDTFKATIVADGGMTKEVNVVVTP